jgi:trigger factor
MNISLDQQSATDGLITIKIDEQDYQNKVSTKLKDYAKKATIKGFRQGMVPAGVVKKMFGKSILVEEVNQIISSSINNFIKEKKLKVLGDPMPDTEKTPNIDWDFQKEFEFVFKVGMAAEFKVDLSSKVKIKKYAIEIDQTIIDETILETRKRYGKPTYPEVSEPGDILYGEIAGATPEEKKNTYIIIDKAKTKAQKQFLGVKKDDVVAFNAKEAFENPADQANALGIHEGDLAGVDGQAAVKVTFVSRVEPAEINQELFDKVFGKDNVKTEEEFVNKIKETIGANYERETNHLLDHEIEHHLMDTTNITLPDAFLKHWLKNTGDGTITDEVLEKEFNDYKNSIKMDLIKNQIAEENKISVESAEVRDRARQLVISQFGGEAVAAQLNDRIDQIADNYLQGNNGQNFMRLYNALRTEKVMAVIKGLITVTEKKVSLDEFKKAVAEHQH